jgi:hypothetical protein
VQISCRPIDWSVSRKIVESDLRGELRRDFTISFRASSPLFVSVAEFESITEPNVVEGLAFTFPMTFEFEFTETIDQFSNPVQNTNFVIPENHGNWQAHPIIRLYGTMDDVELINTANGHSLRLLDPIVDGDWIEIDVASGTVRNSMGENAFDQWDTTSDWMLLESKRTTYNGENSLILNVSGFDGDARMSIRHRNTYAGG